MNANVLRKIQYRNISINGDMDVEGKDFEDIDVIIHKRLSLLANSAFLGVLHDRDMPFYKCMLNE